MMMVAEALNVGLAEIRYSLRGEKLKSIGLGSCVGVIVYLPNKNIAGMAHVMLPESSSSRSIVFPPGKFADTAVQHLVGHFLSKGISTEQLRAKIAGGAEMFKAANAKLSGRIGPRNVEAVKVELNSQGIRLIAEDIGGHYGRTIEFMPDTGDLFIRTIHLGEKSI